VAAAGRPQTGFAPRGSAGGGEVARLAALLREARSAVALTGAGISVPSGIPDFRSPGTGLWRDVDPMEVAHIDAFHADAARFWSFYGRRFASLRDKQPNAAHRALAALGRAGLLDAVITQNVDMLHRRADRDARGGDAVRGAAFEGDSGPHGGRGDREGAAELVEVHGSIATSRCLSCPGEIELEEVRARLASAPDGVPRCEHCDAPLKPGVVLFGELLDARALERARDLCAGADVLLCVGSSLEVHPVAALPELTRAAGGAVAILTQGPTPLDSIAAVRLHGDVVEELTRLLAALGI